MKKSPALLAAVLLGFVTILSRAQAPVPFINQPLVPDATAPGGAQFTLTINGTGFGSSSIVNWNGSALATTFVSGSQLTAVVAAADIATAGTASVTVLSPAPGGGTSNVVFFTVTANVGDAVAFTLASSPATGYHPSSVAAGDFNGDGKLDLAVVNICANNINCYVRGTVSILLGDGKGNFTLASSPTVGNEPLSVAVGDFNGDGNLDLAVTNAGDDTVSILLGDGKGSFTLASSPATGYDPSSVAAGDFNGDGKLDLAVANSSSNINTVSILLGDGTGNFTLASSLATGWYAESVAVGDFNGDGKLDLAVANGGSNTVSIMLGDGTGNFTLAASLATDFVPWSVAVGDFNGDDILDLAVSNVCGNDPSCNSPGTVSILLGDGTGNFVLTSSAATGFSPDVVAVGDVNGDGVADLAVANGGSYSFWSDTLSILLGDGTGNFNPVASPVVGDYPWSLALGEFNGDGKLDLATANQGDNTASILLQGLFPLVTLSPNSLTFGLQLVGTVSKPQNVKLTNTGGATLFLSSISASTNFSQTNNCGSSLAVGASCTITVTLQPHGIGTLNGTVTISNNASNSPQTISLSGVGTVVAWRPDSLDFGNQAVGSTSAPRTVVLANRGNRALSITGVHLSGANAADFGETNTCGSSLAAGASCTFSVTFTPKATGSRTATLRVADNGGGSPQTVALSGNGME